MLKDKIKPCPVDLGYPKNRQSGQEEMNEQTVWIWISCGQELHGLRGWKPTEMLLRPQVSLQLASGAFLLNQAFCDAIQIPMEKLKWTSPFICLRMSLTNRRHDSKSQSPQHSISLSSPAPPYNDNSLEAEAEGSSDLEPGALLEHTGKLWATVVALAWLEHSSASYFIEWELIAAKASSWLEQQKVPEGRTPSTLKATARQLFVLLRHWDENLEFNMLCYNPNYV